MAQNTGRKKGETIQRESINGAKIRWQQTLASNVPKIGKKIKGWGVIQCTLSDRESGKYPLDSIRKSNGKNGTFKMEHVE